MRPVHAIVVPVCVLAFTPVVAAVLLLIVFAAPFMLAYSMWRGKV